MDWFRRVLGIIGGNYKIIEFKADKDFLGLGNLVCAWMLLVSYRFYR